MPATSDYGKHILILILRDFYCDKPAFLMSHLSDSSNLATCQAGITAPVVEQLKGRNRENFAKCRSPGCNTTCGQNCPRRKKYQLTI
jgi:hypothetical protein